MSFLLTLALAVHDAGKSVQGNKPGGDRPMRIFLLRCYIENRRALVAMHPDHPGRRPSLLGLRRDAPAGDALS